MQTNLLINGELTPGAGAALPILDPANGEAVCEVDEASPEQIDIPQTHHMMVAH